MPYTLTRKPSTVDGVRWTGVNFEVREFCPHAERVEPAVAPLVGGAVCFYAGPDKTSGLVTLPLGDWILHDPARNDWWPVAHTAIVDDFTCPTPIPPMPRTYKVTWAIDDVAAADPLGAARHARKVMADLDNDPEAILWFTVQDIETGARWDVDLGQGDVYSVHPERPV